MRTKLLYYFMAHMTELYFDFFKAWEIYNTTVNLLTQIPFK